MGNSESQQAAGGSGAGRERDVPEKAQIAKRQIEIYYRDFKQRFEARRRANAQIDYGKHTGRYDEQTRLQLRREQFLRELDYIRRRRKPLSMADFHIIRKIGQGSYGGVFLVRARDTGELFAIKQLLKSDMVKRRQVSHVWLERFVLATVGEHPHVVKMFYSFQDTDYLYLVMEYLPGGDLLNMLIRHGYLAENWARFYIAELIVAIDALHRTGIIHRDIKPDNILFSASGHVVLSDFGLCKFVLGDLQSDAEPANAPTFINNVRSGKFDLSLPERKAAWQAVARHRVFSAVGTPSYIAPEVLNESVYTEACDWWSVGAILYEMLIGVPPFLSDTPENTIAMIRNWRAYLEFPRNWPKSRLSDEALDLMSRLLCDSSVRLGNDEGLAEFKQHPFFRGVDWNNLAQQKAPFVPELDDDSDTRYFDDEFATPPLLTSNATDSDDNEIDQTNNSSTAGSADTAVCTQTSTTSAPSRATSARRISSSRRSSSKSSRLRDLEFLGFTYMGPDHRATWHPGSLPSSAPPPRHSGGRPPPRVRSSSTLPIRDPQPEPPFSKRSNSAAATPTTTRPRAAPPLPPHPPASHSSVVKQSRTADDVLNVDGSVHGLGISPISESHSDSRGGPEQEQEPATRQLNETPEDTPPMTRLRRARARDAIVEGLGAISVTESYPVGSSVNGSGSSSSSAAAPPGRQGAGAKAAISSRSVPNLTLTAPPHDAIPIALHAAAAPHVESQTESQPKPELEPEPEPVTHGRSHKLSLLPDEVMQAADTSWADAALDAAVASTEDVVRFVEDAVEGLESAAADLDVDRNKRARTSSAGNDIQAVITQAASELNGTALELHRHLSESSR